MAAIKISTPSKYDQENRVVEIKKASVQLGISTPLTVGQGILLKVKGDGKWVRDVFGIVDRDDTVKIRNWPHSFPVPEPGKEGAITIEVKPRDEAFETFTVDSAQVSTTPVTPKPVKEPKAVKAKVAKEPEAESHEE